MKRYIKRKTTNAVDMNVTDAPCEQTTILLPLHPHSLTKVNPRFVYQAYDGHWKCDNCQKENGPLDYPYNCKMCSYDICLDCSKGLQLEAHEHPLYYVNTSQLFHQNENGIWSCSVCSCTSAEISQTHSLHCSPCNFDLCLSCGTTKQYLIHCHPLVTVKTSIVYPSTGGSWACDICGRTSRFNERYSRHCLPCQFDACSNCLKEYPVQSHPHPMVRADSNYVYARFSGGWRCDNCGSLHNTLDDNKPWHCQQCEHDLCDSCMRQLNTSIYQSGDDPGPLPRHRNQSGDDPGPLPRHRTLISNSVLRNPHLATNYQPNEPEDPMTSGKEQSATHPPEAVEEGDECIICTERPKNATMIHGDTGHLCCCWACAQVVKQRGDPCPICRLPIDHVIRQFKA